MVAVTSGGKLFGSSPIAWCPVFVIATSRLEHDDLGEPRKQIRASRSFGDMVEDLAELGEAVTWYIDCAA